MESEVQFNNGYEELRKPHEYSERITIEAGWLDLSDGYFCRIQRDGICVEDFGHTRRSALRYARSAWQKEKYKKIERETGYPRVRECEDGV